MCINEHIICINSIREQQIFGLRWVWDKNFWDGMAIDGTGTEKIDFHRMGLGHKSKKNLGFTCNYIPGPKNVCQTY
jgi:hypothetical protein